MTPRSRFEQGRFHNPDGPAGNSLAGLLRWKLTSRPQPWPAAVPEVPPQPGPAPLPPGGLRATFVGQSTFLLQFAGLNVLTDPVWSDRVGPWNLVGPRRRRPPGLALERLPRIDLVLVSHNHYDHLDVATLARLQRRWDPLLITTLGNERFLRRKGFRKVLELDWWQERVETLPGGEVMAVQALPAQHFSSRHLFDRDRTLWAGFAVRAAGRSVYFVGDSGYGEHFAAIGRHLKSPDLALIPIGAYEPRWFMRRAHVNPQEAVRIHLEVRPRLSLAMHFGTFQLTDEGMADPALQLQEALRAQGVSEDRFQVPRFGVSVEVPPAERPPGA